ncbi:MAG: NUDIX hydrolase [Betaproteobacteria bacterium]|nr:NUDIX hydrolase [Betaproteobacteria bacterium]
MHDSGDNWTNLNQELGVITPRVGAVVAVVRSDGGILLLQRPSGRWCLPCGYADIGETPETTALREVKEETGLDVTLRHFLGIATTLEDSTIPFMWEVVFIADAHNLDEFRLSHEHLTAEWISHVDKRLWHSTHESHARSALRFTKGT